MLQCQEFTSKNKGKNNSENFSIVKQYNGKKLKKSKIIFSRVKNTIYRKVYIVNLEYRGGLYRKNYIQKKVYIQNFSY